VTRLEAQTARLETGRYLVPAHAPWLDEFRRELQSFPMGK
jgi:phage terminase large subunit-like protein